VTSWPAIWPSDVAGGHLTTITRETVLTLHRYLDDSHQRAQSPAGAVTSGRTQQRTPGQGAAEQHPARTLYRAALGVGERSHQPASILFSNQLVLH